MATNLLVMIGSTHNVWLKDYPHLLIPLMLSAGVAMIAIGIAGLSIRIKNRKSALTFHSIVVLMLAFLSGIFLIAFALWIFAAVYLRV